ncbi:2-C-methyl-D-erythritol 4-phosphate cytidylyltransferase [Spiroplasma endosymbiont of Anurida maritima]|uniref:2-C-methyl-D-erythritol 4-phosphate cytidylyltransferase n=1 Tax=Spiroplasma endosymbiont of Anurida maritima TaxID=2967972 RepID=UPI0036D344D7
MIYLKIKKIIWTDGGSSRTHSVYQGFLKTIDIKVDNILVHDGARPFVSINLINSLLKEISTKDFALPAIKTTDCIKKVEDNKLITIENENLHAIQTPQAFKKGVLNQAFIKWDKKTIYKDDAELIEKNINSYNFSLVLGEDTNIKVTYKKDLFNNTNDFNGFF